MELIQELREKTASAHQALEKDLIGRIKAISSKQDYAVLLRILYGFYSAMENHIEPYVRTEASLGFSQRRKAHSLIRDMETLGSASDLKSCRNLPPIHSVAAALGALYVLEGSTLGGQVIAKMIRKQLNVEGNDGLAFFLSYGAETPVMWEQFKLNLARPFDAGQQQEIIHAARNTFETFSNWIEQYDDEQL